jgi:hypothetical protein
MLKYLLLLIVVLPVYIFAGQVTVWSEPFILKDHGIAIEQADQGAGELPGIAVYPNPFNHSTAIRIQGLASLGNARLCIYNINGRLLADFTKQVSQGRKIIHWKSLYMPNGLYIIQLKSGNRVINRKIALVK